jgi:ketosteroid isomerase-like protein
MAEENVEVMRRFMDAFSAHDLPALVACCHPDIEFHSTFAAIGGAEYRGHDGVRAWYRDLQEEWGETGSVLEAIYDLDDQVLAFTVFRGRGKRSGAEAALPAGLVARMRDGLLVYFKAYAHREDALSDLGVTENELEPIAP